MIGLANALLKVSLLMNQYHEVQMDDGRVGYLVKVFLTIDKEDWEQNQTPPGFSENLPSQDRLEGQ